MPIKGQFQFDPPYEKIYIGDAGKKGRGVFTRKDIPRNAIIEISPLLVAKIKPGDEGYFDYVLYEWGKNEYALALGFGSLYNHSIKPNADYELSEHGGRPNILIKSIKKIKRLEEITINYNGDPKDKTPWVF